MARNTTDETSDELTYDSTTGETAENGNGVTAADMGALVQFKNLNPDAPMVGGETYIGDLPPALKALPGFLKRIYLSSTTGNDPIFKVLYECTEGQYEGFHAWDNVTLNDGARFKWEPLIVIIGVTPQELVSATRVNPNDRTEAGMRVVGIGNVDLSQENKIPLYFGVQYKMHNSIQQTSVAGIKGRMASMVMSVPVPPPSSVPDWLTK